MTFEQWITSSYPNPSINGQWHLLHILTLIACVTAIIAFYFIFRKKSLQTKRIVLFVLVGILLTFEITRRIVNFCKIDTLTLNNFLSILLFRPMCAMMSFTVMLAVFINKKAVYSFASIGALLATSIFFLYPGVGFNNQFILFENLYSIVTHSLLLILSITFITLGFSKFTYKEIWKTYLGFVLCVAWTFFEEFVLFIEHDAMYFMSDSDILNILKIKYGIFIALYITFVLFYINMFYVIGNIKSKKTQKNTIFKIK